MTPERDSFWADVGAMLAGLLLCIAVYFLVTTKQLQPPPRSCEALLTGAKDTSDSVAVLLKEPCRTP